MCGLLPRHVILLNPQINRVFTSMFDPLVLKQTTSPNPCPLLRNITCGSSESSRSETCTLSPATSAGQLRLAYNPADMLQAFTVPFQITSNRGFRVGAVSVQCKSIHSATTFFLSFPDEMTAAYEQTTYFECMVAELELGVCDQLTCIYPLNTPPQPPMLCFRPLLLM